MSPTKKDITEAIAELEASMLELLDADRIEQNIKLKRIKAHKRLSLARDTVRSLIFIS